MFRRRTHTTQSRPWSRERLLIMLSGAALIVVVLIVGLALSVRFALTEHGATVTRADDGSLIRGDLPLRDRIAAAPMADVDPQAAFSPDPATIGAGTIEVPAPTILTGPAGVATGFPQTAEGAVGQLAAIEQRVLEAMSLPVAREVHDAWVRPGGPSFAEWGLTGNVTSFLTYAYQGGQEKDLTTVVSASPAAGQVKGSDGPSWTLACVLLDVQAWIKTESRMGYGFCSRMEWIEGRWQVAAGTAPATAPSAWPGSNAAVAAGWLTWTEPQVR
jgi:hypothetical protein